MRGLNPRSAVTYTVVFQVVASQHVCGRRSIACEVAEDQHVDVKFKKHREHMHCKYRICQQMWTALRQRCKVALHLPAAVDKDASEIRIFQVNEWRHMCGIVSYLSRLIDGSMDGSMDRWTDGS